MAREKRRQPLPGVLRRIGAIRVALVAEEAVGRAGVDLHLGGLLQICERPLDLRDLFVRDERILVAEEEEQRTGDARGAIEQATDATAVERRRRLDRRQ